MEKIFMQTPTLSKLLIAGGRRGEWEYNGGVSKGHCTPRTYGITTMKSPRIFKIYEFKNNNKNLYMGLHNYVQRQGLRMHPLFSKIFFREGDGRAGRRNDFP